MTIIIFYQHINREYVACKLLKEKLAQEMNADVHVFSIDFEYYKAIKLVTQPVDIIFMPWMHHQENYYYLVPFLKENENLIAINLHHEQIGSPISMEYLIPRDKYATNNIYHFVWGKSYQKILLTAGVEPSRIFITGNIRLDTSDVLKTTKEQIAQEFNLDLNKKWILFAENRDVSMCWSESVLQDMIMCGLTKEQAIESHETSIKGLYAGIRDFTSLSNEFYIQNELVYRPHPGAHPPLNLDKRLKMVNSYSIYEWLSKIDIFVTASSTSIFEADSLGLPCVVCDSIDTPAEHTPYGIDKYTSIKTMNDLNENIIKEAQKLTGEKIYEEYIGYRDFMNIRRVVETTKTIISTHVLNSKMEMIEVPKKFMLTKKRFELITRIFAKLGILKLFKFPRSAYREYKDIPYIKKNIEPYI